MCPCSAFAGLQDNSRLADLHAWMDKHHEDLKSLSTLVKDKMKLPQLNINGAPLTLCEFSFVLLRWEGVVWRLSG